MCQFKTVPAAASPDSGSQCRCHAGAAAAEALRQMPPELVEKLFAPLPPRSMPSLPPLSPLLTPPSTPPQAEDSSASVSELGEAKPGQTDANNNHRRSRLRTAQSLPGDKRRVQFADELGQSLTDVRWFDIEPQLFRSEAPLDLLLQIHFEQPSVERALKALMADDCSVKLSGLQLDAVRTGVSLTGYALVKNLSFGKRVFVRISADRWRSSAELEADYAGSLDDRRDAFEFELRCEIEEVDFEFCVGFDAEGHERAWDSNGGSNYSVSLVKPRRATFGLWDDEDSEDEG